MSNIEKELLSATDIKVKNGENRQDYLKRLAVGANDLDDNAFEALSQETDAWINAAFDSIDGNKDLPDFPDAEKSENDEKSPRRRRNDDLDTEKPAKKTGSVRQVEPRKGDKVRITTSRGKVTEGTVDEVDDDLIIVDDQEFQKSRLESIEVLRNNDNPRSSKNDDPKEPAITVGSKVRVTNKRGKVFEGDIVEMDNDVIVLKTESGEEEIDQSRVESIAPLSPAGKKTSPEKTERKSNRTESDNTLPAEEEKEKPRRGRPPGGTNSVSVTGAIRATAIQFLADNGKLPATPEIVQLLSRQGLEIDKDYKEGTLAITFGEVERIIKLLTEHKLLKL